MTEQKPVTPNEARDLVRQVSSALDRNSNTLQNANQFYNGATGFQRSFDASTEFSRTIIIALMWMVFLSMIMNLGTVGVLIWLWIHKV